jgi:TatD DNase family protein
VGCRTFGLAHRRPRADLPARRRGGARLSRRRTPERLPGIVDSHAHLQHSRFDADRDEALERAREAGIDRILVPGWDLPSSEAALALADRHPDIVDAAVGVHPHDAGAMDDSGWERLAALARDPRTRAIGEIGLDHHRNLSPPDAQREALARQLDLAAELDLPVLVHDREAHEETTAALLDHAAAVAARGGRARGALHAFSGDAAMAHRLVGAGYLVSFALPVAFRSAAGPRDAARALPLGSFLVETDAPYLGPDRERRNEPTTVLRVTAELGRLREAHLHELATSIAGAYRSMIG